MSSKSRNKSVKFKSNSQTKLENNAIKTLKKQSKHASFDNPKPTKPKKKAIKKRSQSIPSTSIPILQINGLEASSVSLDNLNFHENVQTEQTPKEDK